MTLTGGEIAGFGFVTAVVGAILSHYFGTRGAAPRKAHEELKRHVHEFEKSAVTEKMCGERFSHMVAAGEASSRVIQESLREIKAGQAAGQEAMERLLERMERQDDELHTRVTELSGRVSRLEGRFNGDGK